MANQRISTGELDFDEIKTNLKNYLKGQDQFSDYDFDGSGLSVLLDVLAYNTHYNALYTNLSINEAFLDSAVKRASVVSKAKELGYVPNSARCAEAVINITFPVGTSTSSTLVLPKNTAFNANVDGISYTFYTVQDYSTIRSGGYYAFTDVMIKEGTPLTYRYNYSTSQKYTIPNTNIDLNTLTVRVQDAASSSNYSTYTAANNVLNVNSSSLVYFLKETDNQLYEVEFGNDIIGKALVEGNIVQFTYMACNTSFPNGAKLFTYNGASLTGQMPAVVTTSAAMLGSAAEDTEHIRALAPKYYTTQNRCVTAEDYQTLILANYSNAQSVSVWGGEDAVPPQYGKVFISLKPVDSDYLSDAEKQYVLNTIVKPRKPLTVTPVMVDPVYIKIAVDTTFYYNPQLTSRTAGDIANTVLQTIDSYNDTALGSFGGVFKYSKLSSMIDACEQGITSNITTIKLHRPMTPVYGVLTGYTINLGNPIYNSGLPEESILSTPFYISDSSETCYIDDIPVSNQLGTLRLIYFNPTGDKVVLRSIGSVNYKTGIIEIANINILQPATSTFEFIIKPQSNDVASVQNQFVTIDPALISISAVVDSTTSSYTFTSSRN